MVDFEFDCSEGDLKRVVQDIANRVVCSVDELSVVRHVNRHGNRYYYVTFPGAICELNLKRMDALMKGFCRRGVVSFFSIHY